MSIKMMSAVFGLNGAHISSAQRLVLLTLADHANDKGECWPGLKLVAQKCGLTRQSVQKHIRALEQTGYVKTDSRFRLDGSRASNVYCLNLQGGVSKSIPPRQETDAPPQQGSDAPPPQNLANTEPSVNPQSEPSLKTDSPPKKTGENKVSKKERPPDPIWDTVCEVFGLNPVTKKERTCMGDIVRDLKLKQATPEDIPERIAVYRARWPKMSCTPRALLKYWDTLQSNPPADTPGDVAWGSLGQ